MLSFDVLKNGFFEGKSEGLGVKNEGFSKNMADLAGSRKKEITNGLPLFKTLVMTEFKKKELLSSLNEIDDMLSLSLASITYFHRDKDLKMLSQHWMMHFGRVWNLKHLAEELQNSHKKAQRLSDFTWVVKKFLLREPYTIIDEYCRINKQSPKFKQQQWYEFARIIRNFVTHGFLDKKQYNENKFPVKWDNYKIEWKEIQNGKLDFKKFDIKMPLKIFDEIRTFSNNLPDK